MYYGVLSSNTSRICISHIYTNAISSSSPPPSITRERWHNILHIGYSFNYSQIWKVSLHYLQNWQNYAAFSYDNLEVVTLSKIASTIQYGANTVSVNTQLWKIIVPYLFQCHFLFRNCFELRMKVSKQLRASLISRWHSNIERY